MKAFYDKIVKIKHTKRQGWLDRGLDSDTIGSHVFGAMNIGWYLSSLEKVDPNKVVTMLLVHDLVMAEIEDITPSSGKYKIKKDLEEVAKLKVSESLPKELSKNYLLLFDEFQKMETVEAQVAREADKLETLFQGEVYEEKTDKNLLDEFLSTYKGIFKTKHGKKLFDEIKLRHNQKYDTKS
ncbi:hypothetical protein A2130_02235 [Candidatus Woesebacteria bacterium GWC2_33_12]|uniref:5'-deoxynucleotidase n=1 Tax=Candidatus Woesebacteria bacterium GW2011_GWB1_33_22 TaxID=1618566 RepID=A0A0G0BYQ7_9BACT|nr:MAG: hypothetical protein UR29_C0014G0034 [Candidatus Woesebacteria bacterium GW2011_GWC2_33_12]KKP41607.1 MAG: hypothetical protein UR33_C0012G0033 [Candidatus Woesebacteria bacterium GW2011_GWA2_33_20]KKP44045.1 MAG: hypothetical protein UR35_C0012G0002 [Candidatus Woesebacteria bacterium GW2011_GWB1_33_22]KKP45706.1 MAG: hypothetical protein UR37_C0015G0002 [Microgenomates group bacterium GW2011_GWC1_33_28]KKP49568.1 MAG: hypothetical protein UR41_C0013G0002 [Candidatus Woesebacteria bact